VFRFKYSMYRKLRPERFKPAALTSVVAALMAAPVTAQTDGANGPGVENVARPAGTLLSDFQLGGRMVTFHRGYLYIMGEGKTTLWDVSDFEDPTVVDEKNIGDNGHRWYKFNGDMFWREYSTPEVEGSGLHFLDMSDMLDLKPWDDPSVPMPIEETGQNFQFMWQSLETWPTGTSGGNIHDIRFDDPETNGITSNFEVGNVNTMLRFRIGNLMFITGTQGLGVYDIGDPENVVFLDEIMCDCEQYTTTYHVWGSTLVALNGNDQNEGGHNLVTIDFSDPTDLKLGEVAKTVEEVSSGRYMYFQDEFGFMGQDDFGVKINMETGEIAQRFEAPGPWPRSLLDYQWMPLGSVVLASGSNGGDGRVAFYQHQDEPDTRGPEVFFHHPFAGSTNNPVSTVIGFSIPEILDERTLTNESVELRPVDGGPAIEGDFTWTSYEVLNFVPRQMLEPDTTYEFRFVEGGVKDVAGNGMEEFSFRFSTGSSISEGNPDDGGNTGGGDDGGGDDAQAPQITNLEHDGTSPLGLDEAVTFTAQALDADGTLEFRWSVDGQDNTDWSTDNSFTTRFDASGTHSVRVQARNSAGLVAASSTSVVVAAESTPSTASQSGPLALDAINRRVWTANPDNDTVTSLDADSLAKLDEIPVCDNPTSLALDANNQLWVSCRESGSVEVRDTQGQLVASLDTGIGSQPIAVVADNSHVYVSEIGSGEISRFDIDSLSLSATLELGPKPRAMAITPDGERLLVTRFVSDAESQAGTLWEVSLNSFSLSNTIDLPLDTTSPDSGNAGRGLPNYLASVAVNPSGDGATVVGKKDNILRGMARDGNPLTFETSVRNTIAEIDLDNSQESVGERADIDNHSQPSAVLYSPLGSHLFVAMQGNNRVVILDPQSKSEITRVDVGRAPQGLLVDPDTNRLFVKNFMDRSVSVLDADGLLSNGNEDLPLLATVDTVAQESLSDTVLTGKRVFYNARDERMSEEGYISCSSCHLDGEEDGRVWDFTDRGEGLRNTISLLGRGGMAHGRVHWSANFDEIQDFEQDIRGPFGGQGFLTDSQFEAGSRSEPLGDSKAGLSDELDALAAYVSSLDSFPASPYRDEDGSLTPEAQAGRDLFEAQGCAACHTGSAFTDSSQGLMHDVGTLGPDSGERLGSELLGIDTPTLKGIWDTAPYLHDGSAQTLRQVLTTANPEDSHGTTSTLNETELDQLVAYLRQIDGNEPGFSDGGIELSLADLTQGETIEALEVPLAIETSLSDVSQVTYYANGEEVASSGTGPDFTADWSPSATGNFRLQAQAQHNDGRTTSLSPELQVSVTGSGNGGGSDEPTGAAGQCNWFGSLFPLCEQTQSGWGWENEQSCIALSTCSDQPEPYGPVEGNPDESGGDEGNGGSEPANNMAPEASFTTQLDGLVLTADASLSSDPDGDSLSFTWSFGDGDTASGAQVTHGYAQPGEYTVELVVSDGELSDRSSVTLTAASPEPPASDEGVACEVLDVNSWSDGFTLSVSVTNATQTAIQGWSVDLAFDQTISVVNSWNATLDSSGSGVSAQNNSYNGQVAPGDSASFGFQGTHNGDFDPPSCQAFAN